MVGRYPEGAQRNHNGLSGYEMGNQGDVIVRESVLVGRIAKIKEELIRNSS